MKFGIGQKVKKRTVLFIVLITTVIIGHQIASHYEWYELINSMPYHRKIKMALLKRLSMPHTIESSGEAKRNCESYPFGYVMNGVQRSLKYRIEYAIRIYNTKIIKEVLVPRRAGITEFDPQLSRNLTNDEWTTRQLHTARKDSVNYQFFNFEEGTFGTISEIKALLEYCNKIDIHRIAIISSIYHTRRIDLALTHLSDNRQVQWKIFGAPEPVSFRGLLIEWSKLIAYQYVILPFSDLNT